MRVRSTAILFHQSKHNESVSMTRLKQFEVCTSFCLLSDTALINVDRRDCSGVPCDKDEEGSAVTSELLDTSAATGESGRNRPAIAIGDCSISGRSGMDPLFPSERRMRLGILVRGRI